MNRPQKSTTLVKILALVIGAVSLCTGCDFEKGDCTTLQGYGGGTEVNEGSVTVTITHPYPSDPATTSLGGFVTGDSYACMQSPATCSTLYFEAFGDQNLFFMQARYLARDIGQVVALPSQDVVFPEAFLDDGEGNEEPLTLLFGTLTDKLSLNNFDVHFDLMFTGANGAVVAIQNGRVANLNGHTISYESCPGR